LEVFARGFWSVQQSFGDGGDWQVTKTSAAADQFELSHAGEHHKVEWSMIGDHNMMNAVAAVAAAHHVGVPVKHACQSLAGFKSVKRRLEKIFDDGKVKVFDDFAHHPTAIQETLAALRNRAPEERIIAVLEPRSNTMKQGVHKDLLSDALQSANNVMIFASDQVLWNINELESETTSTFTDTETLLEALLAQTRTHYDSDSPLNILIMSNGGFEGLHRRLKSALEST
jgi:UDP-N-acetylmuramate: L-alanyl-gamma-D-glutamyl-meso-diaminopimelate ligase